MPDYDCSDSTEPKGTSPAKTRANRANAKRSTGPRTSTGKARSSANAIRHGLLAKRAVILDEDRAAYLDLRRGLNDDYAPVGVMENLLVERVAFLLWRLKRAAQAEAEILAEGSERYALGCIRQRRPPSADPPVHAAAISDPRTDLIVRYETTAQRLLSRTLFDLERVQARRMGRSLAPTVTVSVDLGGSFEPEETVEDVPKADFYRPVGAVDVLAELTGGVRSDKAPDARVLGPPKIGPMQELPMPIVEAKPPLPPNLANAVKELNEALLTHGADHALALQQSLPHELCEYPYMIVPDDDGAGGIRRFFVAKHEKTDDD